LGLLDSAPLLAGFNSDDCSTAFNAITTNSKATAFSDASCLSMASQAVNNWGVIFQYDDTTDGSEAFNVQMTAGTTAYNTGRLWIKGMNSGVAATDRGVMNLQYGPFYRSYFADPTAPTAN
jgi:hypothetical protein